MPTCIEARDLAANGRDAYADLCDRDFDVEIIDRMVPGLDGLSLVRKLREEGRSTPVLMLTAFSLVEDRVAGLEGGADDYLGKPFALTDLVARLNALARGHRRRPTSQTCARRTSR